MCDNETNKVYQRQNFLPISDLAFQAENGSLAHSMDERCSPMSYSLNHRISESFDSVADYFAWHLFDVPNLTPVILKNSDLLLNWGAEPCLRDVNVTQQAIFAERWSCSKTRNNIGEWLQIKTAHCRTKYSPESANYLKKIGKRRFWLSNAIVYSRTKTENYFRRHNIYCKCAPVCTPCHCFSSRRFLVGGVASSWRRLSAPRRSRRLKKPKP